MTKENTLSLAVINQIKSDPSLKNVSLHFNINHTSRSHNCKTSKRLCVIFFTFSILLFIITFLLTWTLQDLQGQVQTLETQMKSLMFMYHTSSVYNGSLYPARLRRSVNYNESSIRSYFLRLFNVTNVRDDRNSDIMLMSHFNEIIPIVPNRLMDHENNTFKIDAQIYVSDLNSVTPWLRFMNNSLSGWPNFLRSETQSHTKNEIISDHGLIVRDPRARRLQRSEGEVEKRRQSEEEGEKRRQGEEKGETEQQGEEKSEKRQQSKEKSEKGRQSEEKEKTGRQIEKKGEKQQQNGEKRVIRRQNGKKGEKRQRNRKGHKRNHRRSRPLVATFVGAVPEQKTGEKVYIGPWAKSEKDHPEYDLTNFYLVEDNMSIEIVLDGLYMISVQIFYFGEPLSHSYWILLNSEGLSTKQKLVTCATAFSKASEISCYTSIVTHLRRGDRLSLQHQEENRLINMQEGYSQIQLTLLANDRRRSM